jgi:exonuclease III
MRIDLVLVSKDVEVRGCTVDRAFRKVGEGGDTPSDHAPLVVEFG